MPPQAAYDNVSAALRAPRVAVAVPNDGWQLHARRAIEFFSRVWGGQGNVVVPLGATGEMHPAVFRLLRRFDPDYICNIRVTLGDRATLVKDFPIVVDDKVLEGPEREKFLDLAASEGPVFFGDGVSDEFVDQLARRLNCFADPDGYRRIHRVHPAESPPEELLEVRVDASQQVLLETGDVNLDLALALHQGLPKSAVDHRRLADGSLAISEASAILARDNSFQVGSPFEATRHGLAQITSGWGRGRPVVVLGSAADDMSLAMLWDRLAGSATWIPVTAAHTRWLAALSASLRFRRSAGSGRTLVVTSTTWSSDRCQAFMRKLMATGALRGLSTATDSWEYIDPHQLDCQYRLEWRVQERWDERHALPTLVTDDGADMATSFPLIAPEDSTGISKGWVVTADCLDRPIHRHNAIRENHLIAADQLPQETFVRASGRGIAFESGRFDFVASGASRAGQLAQPKLRWPSLMQTMQIIAAANNTRIQLSDPGRLGKVTARLWGGRKPLTEDLAAAGTFRKLLDVFVADVKQNGPIDRGAKYSDEERRLRVTGTTVVPFGALTRAVTTTMEVPEVRSWLDEKVALGAIRVGLVLECGLCGWPEFYRADEVSHRFTCKRCGSDEPLAQSRWRSPLENPRWYYSLHPSVVQFLENNTDVPLLAVRKFQLTRRADEPVFEIEFVRSGETRPSMEIDFALMSRDGLVLGEAKSTSRLDGDNDAARTRDARKLIDAAELVGAREICFATTKAWTSASLAAIEAAVSASGTKVCVSVLERLGTDSPTDRRVLHNASGP